MPTARLAFLQEAVKETLHNPQLIADGERTERIIEYLDPVSTQKNALKVVSNVTPEQRKRVQDISQSRVDRYRVMQAIEQAKRSACFAFAIALVL